MSAELAEFAAAVAPHVDRLAIAVHPRAGRRDEIREAAERLGIRNGSAMVSFRTLWLAGPVTREELASIVRYVDPGFLPAALYAGVEEGLLEGAEGVYRAGARAREFLDVITAVQGEVVDELWIGHDDALEALTDASRRVIAGAATERGAEQWPAFTAMVRYEPAPTLTPAHAFLEAVTVLRYLRADAHALAIDKGGVDLADAGTLSAIWYDERGAVQGGRPAPPDSAALLRLAAQGLVEEQVSVWSLTETGRTTRERIEATTNELAGEPWRVLTADERARWLTDATALPG